MMVITVPLADTAGVSPTRSVAGARAAIRRALRLLATLAVVGCSRGPSQSAAQTSAGQLPAAGATSDNMQVSQSRQNAITASVAKVSPSVVTVQTEAVDQSPQDPFDIFFGQTKPRTQAGLGTGFVVRGDGVIVTNAHVVAGAKTISVMMRDGKVYGATVLGQDQTNDIAVLRIPAKNLPTVKLGNSNTLLIGEWVIAIGNPYGFDLGNSEPSVSVGVVSATRRNLVAPTEGGGSYFDMIQTDAVINPGNSGGPLVDADGEVIGVNTVIFSPNGGSVGLGFAIPIDRVARVVDDLLTHGSIRSPWIGVRMKQTTTGNPRDLLTQGAVIASIEPGSPAAAAGLQAGDVIIREGTRVVHNPFDWEAALLDLRVGSPAQLVVQRGSRQLSVNVNVSDRPEVSAAKVEVLKQIELVTVTPAIAAERNLRSQQGALIYNVTQQVADEIGIQAGDVIVQVDNHRVTSAEDASRAITAAAGQGAIRMLVEHQGQYYFTDFAVR
jgi:serine protease Do